MTAIIPKSKAKGTDICAMGDFIYIIRSDLGCYMRTRDLNKGSDISIFSLHPSCRNGDHYLGGVQGYFYIIKGNSYRRVRDLTTDSEAQVFSLHPNCQGGDHYYYNFAYNLNPDSSGISLKIHALFNIIFQQMGTFRLTKDLHQDTNSSERTLHPSCRNGLYYWTTAVHCYFIKPALEWGVEFCVSKNLSTDEFDGVYSVHPDVVNFLPGGLSVTQGRALGRWENIKTITNDSNSPWTWQKKINKKVGYNKEMTTEITHNWKIAASVTLESGDLAKLIAKFQLSFSTEYGGSHVNTEKESWEEVTEEEEQLTVELKPNESVYLWQYRLDLGKEPVLFCRDLKIAKDSTPPTEVPLAPAQP